MPGPVNQQKPNLPQPPIRVSDVHEDPNKWDGPANPEEHDEKANAPAVGLPHPLPGRRQGDTMHVASVKHSDEDDTEDADYDDGKDEEKKDQLKRHGKEKIDSGERPDFEQFVAQIHPEPETFDRVTHRRVFKDSLQMSVLIIGVESMSRVEFQRRLPLTYDYLKSDLRATVLNGYNIVGDATMAALLPMLTGEAAMKQNFAAPPGERSRHTPPKKSSCDT